MENQRRVEAEDRPRLRPHRGLSPAPWISRQHEIEKPAVHGRLLLMCDRDRCAWLRRRVGAAALILAGAPVSNGGGSEFGAPTARPMDRLANAVILSWGWRRRGIAFGAGALSALAMPPFFVFPILWITLPVLVWLIDGAVAEARSGRVRRLRPAFAIGWWFGFGYFLAGLWWVGNAFLVEADQFVWLMPFAVLAASRRARALLGTSASRSRSFCGATTGGASSRSPRGLGAAEWLRGTSLHRLSLERDRLRADGRRDPDAVGGALRPLRAERHRRR